MSKLHSIFLIITQVHIILYNYYNTEPPTTHYLPQNIPNPTPNLSITSLPKSGLLATGGHHNCYILGLSGKLMCWGNNSYGQTEVHPDLLANTRFVTTGAFHSCAFTQDHVLCWGRNSDDQCSYPDIVAKGTWQMSAGWMTTCAVLRSEKVMCWGYCKEGICDIPSKYNKNVGKMETGWGHSCAIGKFNKVFCYGWNNEGQSDVPLEISMDYFYNSKIDGDSVFDKNHQSNEKSNENVNEKEKENKKKSNKKVKSDSQYILQSIDPTLIAIEIATGYAHTCAILASRKKVTVGLRCWGNNFWTQSSPPSLPPSTLAILSAGARHSCVLSDNSTKCWGSSGESQCNIPPSMDSEVATVKAGYWHTCGISMIMSEKDKTVDYSISCWGSDEYMAAESSRMPKFQYQDRKKGYITDRESNKQSREKQDTDEHDGV